ncbi:hypothetical protein ScPMuIL_013801 [Solemya velum]
MLISVVLTVVLLVSYSRMTETTSYADCLAKMNKCEDDCERHDSSAYRTGCKYGCAVQFVICIKPSKRRG